MNAVRETEERVDALSELYKAEAAYIAARDDAQEVLSLACQNVSEIHRRICEAELLLAKEYRTR